MPRENTSQHSVHPCNLWLEWKGKDGVLTFWDKNANNGEGSRVVLDVGRKPVQVLYLHATNTVRGYNKKRGKDGCGLFANEVADQNGILTVRYFDNKEVVAIGKWSDIKDKVTSRSVGGSFVKNVYVAIRSRDKVMFLACVQMGGCALGPWFDFVRESGNALHSRAVVIGRGEHDATGEVEFYPPAFALTDASAEEDDAAGVLQKKLTDFLTSYYQRGSQPEGESAPAPDGPSSPAVPQRGQQPAGSGGARQPAPAAPAPTTPSPAPDDGIPDDVPF